MSLFFRACACALFLCISLSPGAAQTRLGTDTEAPPPRRALLIGNSNYDHLDPLKNPKNDVDQLDATLKQLGFLTDVRYDLTHDDFVGAISDFQNKIALGDIVLFYYSGHGVQVGGANYLMPVNMPKNPTSAQLTGIGISLPWVRQHLDGAKLSLVILDACRSLANVSAKGPTDGLAPFFARGSLIAYAADEGQAASDNDTEDVSLFTKHLIAELNKVDETLCQLFGGVRAAVDQASSHVQFPFVYDGVIGEFVFNRATTKEAQKLSAISGSSGWNKAWISIKDSDNPNDYAAFLGTEPKHTTYTKVAADRLSTLMSFTAKAVGIAPLSAQEAPEVIAIANQAERLFYEGAYRQALETYKKLVLLRPTEVAVLYDYATCLLHLGRNDDAIQSFTEALKLDPEFPWAYHNRGVAYHLKGSLQAAIVDYDEALKRKPSNALVYNNLALAKRQLGDLPGADSDAKESLSLDPHYAPAYYNRATILDSTGDKQAAAHYKNEGTILTVPTKESPLDRAIANH